MCTFTLAVSYPSPHPFSVRPPTLKQAIIVDRNESLNMLHIGYCIGSKWWHQGITSEAFSAIIPYLFEEVGANRIESLHDPCNPHSGNVMKKCGLVLRSSILIFNGFACISWHIENLEITSVTFDIKKAQ